MKIQTQISPVKYRGSGFIGEYQKLVKEVVIPYQYSVLKDEAEDTEKSHVIKNFINAGKAILGEDAGDGFYGMVFQDSDVAKWLEAVAYALAAFKDEELEKTADDVIKIIAAAQDKDGYLNTYYTIKDRDKRFKNLFEGHELYCSGHMIEAACAYFECTGKDELLKVAIKNGELLYRHFIEEGNSGFPGHPEVELALVKLYRATGNEKFLALAKEFIYRRGQDPEYFIKEVKSRNWTIFGSNPYDFDYQQSGAPVLEQKDAVGHAVRAVYLYTGMADLASETQDKALFSACERLFDSVMNKRSYITGGIGSTVHGEAFTVDYDLPNDTVYAETCASVGLIFFASRMLECDVDSKYSNAMERAFYNTVLAGMQLDGKRFFYVNPLEVIPSITQKAVTHKHVLTTRPKWYACACCPPNVARLISSISKYAYGENGDTAYCHLYASGEVEFKNGVRFTCETEYPYGFTVNYKVERGGNIAIRLPEWSDNTSITVNGKRVTADIIKGYAYIKAEDKDEISLILDGEPYFVYPSNKIPALSGYCAVMRGPLVYCFEGVDNGGEILPLRIKENGNMRIVGEVDGIRGVKIGVDGRKVDGIKGLYSKIQPKESDTELIAVPYYTWGNRGENQMRVWLPLSK